MVTALSFMHIRSTVGLARNVRRLAHQLNLHLDSWQELERRRKAYAAAGKVEETKHVEEIILDLFDTIIHQLEKITHDEQIILMEEERDLHADEKLAQDFEKKLDQYPEAKEIIEKLLVSLKKSEAFISKKSHEIRKEQKDMLRDRKRWIRYFSFANVVNKATGKTETGEARLAKAIRRIARKQKIVEKEETAAQRMMIQNLEALAAAVKKQDSTAVDKTVKFLKKGGDIDTVFGKEINIITELVHDVNIIMIHMVSELNDEFPKELAELHGAGFPDKPLHELETKQKIVADQIHHQLWRLYKMSKYQEEHAIA